MMQLWEQVINTAMLGTDKGALNDDVFPADLREIVLDAFENNAADRETQFLNKAAIVFNYRQSGFIPFLQQEINHQPAPPEAKPYCSAFASQVLNDILALGNSSLLECWLEKCAEKAQVAPPDVLPVLLDKAVQHNGIKDWVVACSGERGRWLGQFNPAWNFFKIIPDEELWQTGKPEERIKLLQRIRLSSPQKALELLQETWPQENAAGKFDLLRTLAINSSEADLPWLESLLNEKGQKIKDEALNLLKQIPGSSILSQYEAVLREAVTLKTGKAFLGMVNKTSIQIKLPEKIDENIFKTGIEKMSSNKSESDDEFVVYQLTKFVPPAFWEKHFDVPAAQVVEYFEKYAPSLIPALAQSVSRFKAAAWAPLFLNGATFYPEFINLLPTPQSEKYLLKFLDNDRPGIIQHALKSDSEWGFTFTLAALPLMVNNPYQFNRAFYNQYIMLFPVAVINHLEKFSPADTNQQSAWNKMRAYLTELLTIKKNIQQSFNQ